LLSGTSKGSFQPHSTRGITLKRAIVTGNFDGLHLGHQRIFRYLVEEARQLGYIPTVVTFEPHTRHFIQPELNFPLLTPNPEKIRLLKQVFHLETCVLDFSELASLSAKDYVQKILVNELQAALWVMGPNHRFGLNGEGSSSNWKHLLEDCGCSVRVLPGEIQDEQLVSSSAIRKYIAQGNVELARWSLGRPYTIKGTVVHGDNRGNKLGFPTANLHPEHDKKMIPPAGVYGVRVHCEGKEYLGALNIGTQPTFNGKEIRIETHILDFSHNIYGQEVEIVLDFRVRAETKFESLTGLTLQIKQDIQTIKAYYG
jgi:riboflavin kinase / FMN adenylyltransferase